MMNRSKCGVAVYLNQEKGNEKLNVYGQSVFPYTPATNLLYGLKEVLILLKEEGLDQVFAHHRQLAEATRKAVQGCNLEMNALHSHEFSDSLTAVWMPEGHDADQFRKVVLENIKVTLGNGLGKIQGKVFCIGHLGDFNAPMFLGTEGVIEMRLELSGVPF